MSIIEVDGLTKSFGDLKAVDHLNFNVSEGEVFGLLGPNGAGKTTTIRMLACLISPSNGSASVGGFSLFNSHKIREIVGILTENPSLYERLTAFENLDFFAEAYGLSDRGEKKGRIKVLLEFFGLWEQRNRKVATFSKGMKQKLAIARTIVHRPPIIFLDEPTAGLDPESAKGIRDLIENLSQRERHTILLCTHRLEDAERLCNRVMVINKGRSVIIGTPDELQDTMAGKPPLQVFLKSSDNGIVKAVEKVKGVRNVDVDNVAGKLLITVDDLMESTPEIVRSIVHSGGMILSVKVLRPSLEEAYLKLIKEARS
jgi:ABC-2 type transport system ATP-binding protein